MGSNVNAEKANFPPVCWEYSDIKTNDWACEFEELLGVPPTYEQWNNYWHLVYDMCSVF